MVNKDGKVDGIGQMLLADAVATTAGACLGASTTTTYVESAAGVAVGGRTGLTALVIAVCFAFALFLSPLFRNTLAGVSGATIELYDTDGSVGAAKGAGIGAGIYKDHDEAFATLEKLQVIEPEEANRAAYAEAYAHWKDVLNSL